MGPGRQRLRGEGRRGDSCLAQVGLARLLGQGSGSGCWAGGERNGPTANWASGRGSWAAQLLGPKTEKGEEKK